MKNSFLFYLFPALVLMLNACAPPSTENTTSADDSASVETDPSVLESAEPWKTNQLMDPADLAKTLRDKSVKQPTIFSIGPSGDILGSTDIGPLDDSLNYSKFSAILEPLDREAEIVIYCGCCPFENCPNIRPGFELLNSMNFTNHKLLNLSQNLKADWIDKGYPMKE